MKLSDQVFKIKTETDKFQNKKRLKKKKRLNILLPPLIILLALSSYFFGKGQTVFFPFDINTLNANTKIGAPTNRTETVLNVGDLNLSSLADLASYSSLPVGKVENFPVPDAKGTVILIPQIHRNPGSAVNDPSNDNAQVAQEQIYDIEKYLNEKYGINLILLEGEVEGKVPQKEIDTMKEKLRTGDNLAAGIKDLQASTDPNVDPSAKAKVIQELEQVLNNLDRDIVLKGGAYRLAAQGNNVDLYGAEITSTREKSTDIVRNYVYLNDRINSLNAPQTAELNLNSVLGLNSSGSSAGLPQSFNSATLLQLLQNLGNQQNSQSGVFQDVTNLENTANANNDSRLAGDLNSIDQSLNTLRTIDQADAQAAASAPSRSDNPYNNISDKAKLEQMLKQSEQQIQTTIVDQRNQDAVRVTSDTLKNTNNRVAVLQFGAGHEQGMVKDFNDKGYSVIVVTPNEVLAVPQN